MYDCGIYKIENKINGHFYIGQSANLTRRAIMHKSLFVNHKHKNSYFQRAWDKYGKDNFIFSTILFCEPNELTYYEQLLIDKLNPDYNLCRKCVTSVLGIKRSDETKAKISAKLMGHIQPAESRAKMGRPGRKLSMDARQKISEALRHRKITPETHRKMSEAQRNRPFTHHHPPSAETRAKIGAANKRRAALKRINPKQMVLF